MGAVLAYLATNAAFYKNFAILLAEIFPAALKAAKAWQEYHELQLTRERRRQLSKEINSVVAAAVETRDTSNIENVIKNLGRPQAAPDPQN